MASDKRLCVIVATGLVFAVFAAIGLGPGRAQDENFGAVHAAVDFDKAIGPWDGFGFNYVELIQTFDPIAQPQDYGGFSLLDSGARAQILERVFGVDGLKPGLVKMFLDPFHQKDPDGPFDHRSSTRNMREFVQEGYRITRARGGDLTILTTMYGPPAWATRQKVVRGRDFDPAMKRPLVNYLIDWVRFLRSEEKLPVAYLSLHNEGEDWERWRQDGVTEEGAGHDYNMFWPPELVVDFLRTLPGQLRRRGLSGVGVTPGETFSLDRFYQWGYAHAIADDPRALRGLGLLTSHGFMIFGYGRWNGKHTSAGIDVLREKRRSLRTWITSTSWADMDTLFVWQLYSHIYFNKVNGIIPWAGIQRPRQWTGGDPNPGAAFHVTEDGQWSILPGYYHFKQVSRAGQPGMYVARTLSMDPEISVMAFGRGQTRHRDAFTVINTNADKAKTVAIRIRGTHVRTFDAFRTTDASLAPDADKTQRRARGLSESYRPLGPTTVSADGRIIYVSPPRSVTTFFASDP